MTVNYDGVQVTYEEIIAKIEQRLEEEAEG